MITKLTPVAAIISRRRLVVISKQRLQRINRKLTAIFYRRIP